tara:strand:+ start:5702 stop:6667 length:966 start_codon:yes stop_codon:yes gene_type:complete
MNVTEPNYGYSYIKERYNQTKLFGAHFDHTHQSLWNKIVQWKLKNMNDIVETEDDAEACVVTESKKCKYYKMCETKPLISISAADDDIEWGPLSSSNNCKYSGRVLKLVGNKRFFRKPHSNNFHTIDIPYASHAHSWIPESLHFARRFFISVAINPYNHFQSEKYGFHIWRKNILKYCKTFLHKNCTHIIPGQRGYNMPEIAVMYSNSIFSIHPPGDTLARAAIIDSVSLGCIPVFLHTQQYQLWKMFWNSTDCAINLSWEKKNDFEQMNSLKELFLVKNISNRREHCIKSSKFLIYNKKNSEDAAFKLNTIIKEFLGNST